MVILPDITVHSRIQQITLGIFTEDIGTYRISVDKAGLTPRVTTFTTTTVNERTSIIFDISNTNTTYTVTVIHSDLTTAQCTVTVQAQTGTTHTIKSIGDEIKQAVESTLPSVLPRNKFRFVDSLLSEIKNKSESRFFNHPMINYGIGSLLGSSYAEFVLQTVYTDKLIESDIDDIDEQFKNYQWSPGILNVEITGGNVEFNELLKTLLTVTNIIVMYE